VHVWECVNGAVRRASWTHCLRSHCTPSVGCTKLSGAPWKVNPPHL